MTPKRQQDVSLEETPSRYVVGVDLGTTNSAVTYVDTSRAKWKVKIFATPQVVAPGEVEARETLPSFHYQPAAGELEGDALALPWKGGEGTSTVGVFARDHGTRVPGRMIASAKSWLCHSGVDRSAELLPWHAASDVDRLSPVEVSARYLRHIRAAWDHKFPKDPLAEQDLVITLPASFDEVARELTVEAAKQAGLPRVVLIEEPQAAFYAWLDRHAKDWESLVEPGHKILVCDIGGGTTDFTLIRADRDEDDAKKVRFHRVAVGEHLILGGDNLDLALARHLERKLTGDDKLPTRTWDVLVASCRHVKEQLLCDDGPDVITLNLPSAGSKLIGGGMQVKATRGEVCELLVDGFLPRCKLDAKPASRTSGFQQFGLPYAPDAAMTKYLAAFLSAHRHVGDDPEKTRKNQDSARPDIVLFNGGFFESNLLRERLLEILCSWFKSKRRAKPWRPVVLDAERLDLAVAQGAAYYGMVRRGQGVRIAAELARTYYIGIEGERPQAVCLVPASAMPGQDVPVAEQRFDLLVSQPVEFPLYVSSTRLTDEPGQVLAVDREQMKPLPPIRTVIRGRKASDAGKVAVQLFARLTEIGTLELGCKEAGGRRSWQMQFDVRSATETDIAAHQGAAEREGFLDEEVWNACEQTITAVFGKGGNRPPERLIKQLVQATGMKRDRWPSSLLRNIWQSLIDLEPGRRRSQEHEARWLNLLGFSLRPGYGLAVDDWRVNETWRIVQGRLVHGGAACLNESWILWRRIGGGLSAGQQRAIADQVLSPVRALHRRLTGGASGGEAIRPQDSAEIWRLLGSLELLPGREKVRLGKMLIELLPKRKMQPVRPALVWALGRLAARIPMYGPLNTVVDVETASDWLRALIDLSGGDAMDKLAVMQIARRTDDRYRDLAESFRREVLDWLDSQGAPKHFAVLVRDGGQIDEEERNRVFGESLPKGLRIS